MISPVKIWRRQKNVRSLLNKKGVVLSWTVIYAPPNDFKKCAPYSVLLVQLDDGEKLVGQYVETQQEEIKIGMRVRTILRKTRITNHEDVISYGIKFTNGL